MPVACPLSRWPGPSPSPPDVVSNDARELPWKARTVTDSQTRNETRTEMEVLEHGSDDRTSATSAWLESEFPGWTVSVDETATWEGDLRALWIARQEGHHPQAELSAAKLHTRLSEYHHRIERRQAMAN